MPQSSFSLLFCFVSLVSFLWGMSLCLWQVSRSLNYAWRSPFNLCCHHCQVSAIVVVCLGSRSMSLQVVVWISNEWRNCGSIEHLSTKTKGWKVNIVACAHGLGHSWATFKKESKQMWVGSVNIWRVSGLLLLDFCLWRRECWDCCCWWIFFLTIRNFVVAFKRNKSYMHMKVYAFIFSTPRHKSIA